MWCLYNLFLTFQSSKFKKKFFFGAYDQSVLFMLNKQNRQVLCDTEGAFLPENLQVESNPTLLSVLLFKSSYASDPLRFPVAFVATENARYRHLHFSPLC